jgi:hypothetical protein
MATVRIPKPDDTRSVEEWENVWKLALGKDRIYSIRNASSRIGAIHGCARSPYSAIVPVEIKLTHCPLW